MNETLLETTDKPLRCYSVDWEYATDRGAPYRQLVDARTVEEAKEWVRAGQVGNGRIVIVKVKQLGGTA